MKNWTKTSAIHCAVCDGVKNLVFVRQFMLCPNHDNEKTISDCEALRAAQRVLEHNLMKGTTKNDSKNGRAKQQALSGHDWPS